MCSCQGNKNNVAEPEFEVTLPNGTRETVRGEHNAKVKVTLAGGGTYRKL